jgi:hypothetical protein
VELNDELVVAMLVVAGMLGVVLVVAAVAPMRSLSWMPPFLTAGTAASTTGAIGATGLLAVVSLSVDDQEEGSLEENMDEHKCFRYADDDDDDDDDPEEENIEEIMDNNTCFKNADDDEKEKKEEQEQGEKED